jgi:hypothetical protein
MSRFAGKRIFFASFGLLGVLILVGGGWLYSRRPQPIVIASYVPESALGYLEINDWPEFADRLTSTSAWQQLAPGFGVSGKLEYVSKASWLARFFGGGETAILSRSQFAIVVTGLEVRGEEVKPRLALIVETHSDEKSLREVAGQRLPELALNAFGQFVEGTDEYGGAPIRVWRAAKSDKQLVAAQIASELVLANHLDPLRACIDARLGRAPSMANNFHLQNARSIVDRDGSLFGFITGDGVTRLLRFWAFLISGDALSKAALAGAMGDVFTDFSGRVTDGIAYGASFENGTVVDRYALLFKPEMADALRATIKPKGNEPRALDLIPAEAVDVTLINVENPMKTLDGIEAAISARIGVAQSFLLHQFVISAREAFLGLRAGDKAEEAIGDEIANFSTLRETTASEDSSDESSESGDRIWLVAPRDRAFVTTLVERVFTAQGAVLSREKYNGVEIVSSSDRRRGTAAFVSDFLALGKREHLMRLIDSQQSGRSLKTTPQFAAATIALRPSAIKSFESVKDESGAMMATIARWLGESPAAQSGAAPLDQLPFASSATSINDRGIYVESRSPFGNLPFFVALADGSMKGRSTGQ